MTSITLDDKYTQTDGRVYLTGSQALVRLPMMQRARDLAQGLNTAGFISGYRGSPLGIYDLALWQAERHLKQNHVHFQPGVNEDLAATSVWGSQQVGLLGDARYDGVFAMWYGKGPGVDRSGDPLKHGNFAGSAAKGGVLVLCGDDHGARSSTVAHQSDHALIHFGMPILHAANVQEYLDLGLVGFELSRYSGCWVGFKCVTDTVESSASVNIDPNRSPIVIPTDFVMPPAGLNIRLGVLPLQAERQLFESRLLAAQAFARANALDGTRLGGTGRKRLGIVTTGKSYLDVIEALRRLGVDQQRAEELGIAVYKVSMVWPLEPVNLTGFARGFEEIFVVEEKRDVIEGQIAQILYNVPEAERPRLTGKRTEAGAPLLSSVGELDPDRVLLAIAARYLRLADDPQMRAIVEAATAAATPVGFAAGRGNLMRLPSFCAGCPHNTSTRVPDGSKAMGGIGCHGLATWMPDRRTLSLYQMGGEGAPWIGQAPFVDTSHIFQNLGDGTYFHSGLLAIRACVAAGVNITYKILLNGAVGMTGGQPIEGERFEGEVTAPHVASQLFAEGVKRIAVVSDDPTKFGDRSGFPGICSFHHRDELDAVQRELREWKGVSALVYDQACATERRRLRKRGKVPNSPKRLFINPDVCEGCGDCGIQSNCIAIEPIETELGRKRRINQSVCNMDFSCVKGFCPSFVTVTGGTLRARAETAAGSEAALMAKLPAPTIPQLEDVFSVLVCGIGGNGVVTIAAILGMAAHIENKPCTVLDISGLAQRNGAVMSHLRFSPKEALDQAVRIPQGSADLVIGCDLVVAGGPESLGKMRPCRTAVVYNEFVAPTSAFAANPDLSLSGRELIDAIAERSDPNRIFGVDATAVAISVLGNAIGANLFLIGYAWQKGLIPLSAASIDSAIALNGTSVELNKRAFTMGRLAADNPVHMAAWLNEGALPDQPAAESLESLVANREELLRDHSNETYARQYRDFVTTVAAAERQISTQDESFSRAVAKVLAKLMAYKDEYEVGRLFAGDRFRKQLSEIFEGDYKLQFNLAPPLLARMDRRTGRPKKIIFGPWMTAGFRILAKLKFLRGTAFDIFGYATHRKLERALIIEYRQVIASMLDRLNDRNYSAAVDVAELFDRVRGYGVVKEQSVGQLRRDLQVLLAKFDEARTQAVERQIEAILVD